MKKFISKNKIKILEAVILGLIGFLIITFNKISFCHQAYKIDFDQQAFLYWDYLKSLNLIPFRDYFYPYGLLLYFKSINIEWYFIYLFILFLISVFVFISFRQLFKERGKAYLFYFIYSVFIFLFVNPETYVRYAPLVVFVSVISYIASKDKLFKNKSGLLIGLLIGIFFSFINDIFFYSALTCGIFLAIYFLINKNSFNISVRKILIYFPFLLVGFLVGLIPLGVYLFKNNLINDFIFYLNSLSGFYQLAKVAFPPSLKSLENILIILGLIFSVFTLFSKYKKRTLDFNFYYLLSLVLLIFSLEQKNLVRSMYEQISFISLITFFILLNETILNLKNKVSRRILVVFSLNLIFLIFFMIGVDRNFRFDQGSYSFSETNISQCVENKIKRIDQSQLVSHKKVVKYLKHNQKSKVFSFPGDPIFYVLLNQQPPYYPSIYEATHVYSQNKLIQYIKDNKVEYIIINTRYSAIQDDVPDRIRAKVLYEYIWKNFKQEKKIDNFLLLNKSKN